MEAPLSVEGGHTVNIVLQREQQQRQQQRQQQPLGQLTIGVGRHTVSFLGRTHDACGLGAPPTRSTNRPIDQPTASFKEVN